MEKPILFYSNYCEHSKNIVTTILKYQLRGSFTIHCVDNNNNLPKEVDRVPILMHDNKWLSDEGLFAYMDHIVEKISVNKNISPFMVSEMGNSMSDAYSYLEMEDGDGGPTMEHSFVHLKNGEHINDSKIYTPDEDAVVEKNMNYEDIISKRDNELNSINMNMNTQMSRP